MLICISPPSVTHVLSSCLLMISISHKHIWARSSSGVIVGRWRSDVGKRPCQAIKAETDDVSSAERTKAAQRQTDRDSVARCFHCPPIPLSSLRWVNFIDLQGSLVWQNNATNRINERWTCRLKTKHTSSGANCGHSDWIKVFEIDLFACGCIKRDYSLCWSGKVWKKTGPQVIMCEESSQQPAEGSLKSCVLWPSEVEPSGYKNESNDSTLLIQSLRKYIHQISKNYPKI